MPEEKRAGFDDENPARGNVESSYRPLGSHMLSGGFFV